MNKFLLAVVLLVSSSIAYSAQELLPQGIESIGTAWEGEGIVIRTKEKISAEGCADTSLRFEVTDNSSAQSMTSIVLAAFHSGNRVRFYVDGCVSGKILVKAVRSVNW